MARARSDQDAPVRPGAFPLGMRGVLLQRLAQRDARLSDRYRVALARVTSPETAEAIMHALCEDIARRTGVDDPGAGPAALRAWLAQHVLWAEVEQHLIANASYYGPLMRRG